MTRKSIGLWMMITCITSYATLVTLYALTRSKH